MSTPRELTDSFIEAYNQRDRGAIRALLAPVLEYVRPGERKLTSAAEVMAQYETDWAMLSSSSVKIRTLLESAECIVAEITIEATLHGRSLAVETAVVHQWREERLVRYRLYLDPLPPEVSGRTS